VNALTIGSFIAATAGVALLTVFFVRRMKRSDNATEEYFTGGRALTWPIVAGSLLLTNLSTEQLVGLNGAVFGDQNLVGVAWEALAALAMICTALIFLPRYLASGFTTTPAFLEKRFDKTTRSIVSGLFLFGYAITFLPVVLYTGARALEGMFGLTLPLWIIVAGIGTLGSAYAIFGGLKSVAVSDTINGVGLLIGGLAIPILALSALGDGSIGAGIDTLVNERPETMAVLGDNTKSVPWHTLLTGMMIVQVFYWSTNQAIVQRALGATGLAEGQKGVLFAAGMKLVGPLMLCVPGIAALHMIGDLEQLQLNPETGQIIQSTVYPALVNHVLPAWSLGLFAAVLVGAILSSFNSGLNSAATLFSLQFYKGYINRDASASQVVAVGKKFATGLALLAICVAPLLARSRSIFEYLQTTNGLYSVPIISVFFVGIVNRTAPALAAKIGILVGGGLYSTFIFTGLGGWHWLHSLGFSFAVAVATMLLIARVNPKSAEQIALSEHRDPAPVDMTPWRYARPVSIAIVAITALMYVGLTLLAGRG